MTSSIALLCAIPAIIAVMNVITLRRLWASPIFERPQKIAQTILMWVVPGSVFVVRYVLREQRVRRTFDPSTGAAMLVWDNAWSHGSSGVGLDGSSGGHHGHAGGSGGFGGDGGGGSDGGGGFDGGGGGGGGGGGADGGAS